MSPSEIEKVEYRSPFSCSLRSGFYNYTQTIFGVVVADLLAAGIPFEVLASFPALEADTLGTQLAIGAGILGVDLYDRRRQRRKREKKDVCFRALGESLDAVGLRKDRSQYIIKGGDAEPFFDVERVMDTNRTRLMSFETWKVGAANFIAEWTNPESQLGIYSMPAKSVEHSAPQIQPDDPTQIFFNKNRLTNMMGSIVGGIANNSSKLNVFTNHTMDTFDLELELLEGRKEQGGIYEFSRLYPGLDVALVNRGELPGDVLRKLILDEYNREGVTPIIPRTRSYPVMVGGEQAKDRFGNLRRRHYDYEEPIDLQEEWLSKLTTVFEELYSHWLEDRRMQQNDLVRSLEDNRVGRDILRAAVVTLTSYLLTHSPIVAAIPHLAGASWIGGRRLWKYLGREQELPGVDDAFQSGISLAGKNFDIEIELLSEAGFFLSEDEIADLKTLQQQRVSLVQEEAKQQIRGYMSHILFYGSDFENVPLVDPTDRLINVRIQRFNEREQILNRFGQVSSQCEFLTSNPIACMIGRFIYLQEKVLMGELVDHDEQAEYRMLNENNSLKVVVERYERLTEGILVVSTSVPMGETHAAA